MLGALTDREMADVAECLAVEASGVDACLYDLAVRLHTVKYCALSSERECAARVASALREPGLCGADPRCLTVLAHELVQPKLCSKIEDWNVRRPCLAHSAVPAYVLATYWLEALMLLAIAMVSCAFIFPEPPPGTFPALWVFFVIYSSLAAALWYFGRPLPPGPLAAVEVGVVLAPVAPIVALLSAFRLSPLVFANAAPIAYPMMLLPMSLVWSLAFAISRRWLRYLMLVLFLTLTAGVIFVALHVGAGAGDML